MGISKGYVSEPHGHCCARSLPGPKASILINHDGRACLADFGLPAIASDREIFLLSCLESGMIQWISPELIDPERFDLTELPNEGVGLLCPGDGDIRSSQWTDTIRPISACFYSWEDSGRPASRETSRKGRGTDHRRFMGDITALLEVQTG